MNQLGRALLRLRGPAALCQRLSSPKLLNCGCNSYSSLTANHMPLMEGYLRTSPVGRLQKGFGGALALGLEWPQVASIQAVSQERWWLRPFSTQQQQSQADNSKSTKQQVDSLEITEESFKAITDQIPQKPVTFVEGTSYSIVIVAAFAALGFFVYSFVTGFILEPVAHQCFNHTVEKLKTDPRITVRLGDDIRAWGSSSGSRVGRQQIQHDTYQDQNGVEHVRLVFHLGGPGGVATVYANMYQEEGQWRYTYLLADVQARGAGQAQRLEIVPMH